MTKKLELFYPLKNPFSTYNKFGENVEFYQKNFNMPGHNGWDSIGLPGQIIRAAHDGEVVYAGKDANEGNGIVLRTLDQREFKDGTIAFCKSIYWHAKDDTTLVKLGDKVKVGDPLAQCGNTGLTKIYGDIQGTWGTHLHFGIKPVAQNETDGLWYNLSQTNGWYGAIDCAPYWNGYYAEDFAKWRIQLEVLAKKVQELVMGILRLKK